MPNSDSRLWLIDAGYLFNAMRTIGGGYQVDYMKLRTYLEQDGPIWRAYYLNSTQTTPSAGVDRFHAWLQSAPPNGPKIITKLYSLKETSVDQVYCEACQQKVDVSCPHGDGGHRLVSQQQKGVDVGLATLALTHVPRYDTLLLSSGDRDLLDVVEYLSEQGKRIELVVCRAGVSTELQSRADRIYWIDEFAAEVRRV